MVFATTLLLTNCGVSSTETEVPAINLSNLDTTTPPSVDFYQYATGGWQKNNPLRDEYARYGAFDVLRERNEERIKELFASLAEQKNEAGSVGQKILDIYSLGLDSVRLNEEGATTILEELKSIEEGEISQVIASLHLDVANPLFMCYVESDLKNSDSNIMYIAQAGLAMGTREYYLEDRYEQTRERYINYIEQIFLEAGYAQQEATRIAQSVMEVEMAIASASSSNVELRDPQANYNIMTIGEFTQKYNAIDWNIYSQIMGFALPEQIVLGQPKQMECVNSLLKNLPQRVLRDYLTFNLLDSAAPYLSDSFCNISFEFYGKEMSGKQEQQPRWKRSLAVPNGSLGEAVGEMYVEKYFPAEYKAKMMTLVDNLREALHQHISELEWMGEQTKAKAHEKLSTIYTKIGYPDKWKDYSSLEVDPTRPYWSNIRAISKWSTQENLAKLNKPVDRDEWGMTPQTVNAYYNPTTNEICFPAAILQPPFFNPTADDAVNYGAIGVVIGHEMTHGFDDQGRQFDKDGNLADWWSAQDAEAFEKKAQQIVEQFDQIEVLPNLFANGAFTLGENIADQGGLRVAYTAMKIAQNGETTPPIDGFTPEQRFYIGYASVWAQNIRDKEIERLTNVDPHSLGKYRVNQTLKNIDAFYEAFGIESGEMYEEPSQRVVIW